MTSPLAFLVPSPDAVTTTSTNYVEADTSADQGVVVDQTTVVETESTTVIEDDDMGNAFAEDQTSYVMDTTTSSEDWIS